MYVLTLSGHPRVTENGHRCADFSASHLDWQVNIKNCIIGLIVPHNLDKLIFGVTRLDGP